MQAKTIISRAYAEVVSSKSSIEAVDYRDGLRYLNRMMASLASKGIDVGYTKLSSIEDALTVPDGVILGIVKNLALSLYPQYSSPGSSPNALLTFSANRAMDALMAQAINIDQAAQFPSTLPIGSGGQDSFRDERFYSNVQQVGRYIESEYND